MKMSPLKSRIALPTILIVLGTALLVTGGMGVVKSYFDLHAPAPSFSSPLSGGKIERVMTSTPSATPLPPTAIPISAPPTLRPGSVPAPAATSSPTPPQILTPTAIPSPTFAPTPSALPPASSPPDRIVSPAIGLDAPVVPVGWTVTADGAAWDSADSAAGWHLGSAYPGQVGNTVLSGHHNIKGKVFRYLIDLEPDDEVFLYAGDTVYRYSVTEKHLFEEKNKPEEVRRANAQWIAPTDDERLTLVTCWPYSSNTHRLVIVATRIEFGD